MTFPRATYDRGADAVHIALGERGEWAPETSVSTVVAATGSGRREADVILDWREGELVGVEVLAASHRLPRELLDAAEDITGTP